MPDVLDPLADIAEQVAQAERIGCVAAGGGALADADAPAIFGVSANLTQLVGKSWGHVKYDALMDWDTIRFFFWPKG